MERGPVSGVVFLLARQVGILDLAAAPVQVDQGDHRFSLRQQFRNALRRRRSKLAFSPAERVGFETDSLRSPAEAVDQVLEVADRGLLVGGQDEGAVGRAPPAWLQVLEDEKHLDGVQAKGGGDRELAAKVVVGGIPLSGEERNLTQIE